MFHSPRQQLWGDKGWHTMETFNSTALRGQRSWAAPLILSVGNRPVPGSGHWGAKPVKTFWQELSQNRSLLGGQRHFSQKTKVLELWAFYFALKKDLSVRKMASLFCPWARMSQRGHSRPVPGAPWAALGTGAGAEGPQERPQWGGNCPSVQNTHLQGMWDLSLKGWLHRGCASCLKVCLSHVCPQCLSPPPIQQGCPRSTRRNENLLKCGK